jgi:hypothetical protein
MLLLLKLLLQWLIPLLQLLRKLVLLRLQPTTLKSDGGMVAFFIYCMFTME